MDIKMQGGDYSYYQAGGTGHNDFARLSDLIGTNIQKISQNAASLRKMVTQLETAQNTEQFRTKLHQIQHYTNQLAKDTHKHMKQLQMLPPPQSTSEQRQRKMQTERLRNEFGESLNAFQAIQKDAMTIEKHDLKKARSMSARSNFDDDRKEPQLIFLESPVQDQKQAVFQMDEDMDLEVLREREQAVQQLESDITDVNQIFSDLATMVYEQGELVDSIEANVESTSISVGTGVEQLGKASEYQTKVRRKKLILFIILIVVLAVIIGIIIWQTSK